MTTPPSSRPASPIENGAEIPPSDYAYLYSIGKAVSAGAFCGLLASIPINRFFFPMHPIAGFISGAVAGALYSQSSLSNFRELSRGEQVGALIAAYAIQAFATFAICYLTQVPIEFSAALLFPPAAIPVIFLTAAISLALLSFEKGGEAAYEIYTDVPRFKETEKTEKS